MEGMKILLLMRAEKESRLPLKPWLAPLVDLLEDGDGNVRDQAREVRGGLWCLPTSLTTHQTVVALLAPASTPPAARSELKKLLLARNVRKTIADNIISRVLGGGRGAKETTAPTAATEVPPMLEEMNGSANGRSGAATPAQDEVDVVYVSSRTSPE